MAYDWTIKEELWEYLQKTYEWSDDKCASAAQNFINAEYYRLIPDYWTCLQYLIQGCKDLNVAIQYVTAGNVAYEPTVALFYWMDNYMGVTWKTICEAWVTDDFEGRAWTIACIDRMRQLIWDEPFRIIWAAKPEAEGIPD